MIISLISPSSIYLDLEAAKGAGGLPANERKNKEVNNEVNEEVNKEEVNNEVYERKNNEVDERRNRERKKPLGKSRVNIRKT